MRKFIQLFIISIFVACNNEMPIVEQLTGFTADPQPIQETDVTPLAIGEQAPDFNLPATDGTFYSLDDFDAEVLVIIFTCNHCPTAQAYEGRIKRIVEDYSDKDLELIAISPNSPLGLLYEELGYTDLGDTYEDGVIRHKDAAFNFTYLYDGDTEEASIKYGPVATPHAYVFDKDRILQYRGRLDTVEKPGTANAEDLRAAIDELLAGKTVTNPVTKTFGCSTKWAWKTKYKEQKENEWSEKTATLEELNEQGVKKLISNEGSDKLRLINVWATWCAPCKMEYPEFIVLQRMYGDRDFEFVSISADRIEKKEKALDFLNETHSAVPNYIFPEEDKYKLIEAIDPDWNGALPYTMLIEPNGNVVWKHQGTVDFLDLKRAIVGHEMIGRYF